MSILRSLNKEQKEVVKIANGSALILGGAGCGKTFVLINKVAHLIEKNNVSPESILVIAFANKDVKKIKRDLRDLIGDKYKKVNVFTFQEICVEILNENINLMGYTKNFTIYDDEDKKKIIKDCMIELNVSEQKVLPKTIMDYISDKKFNHADYVIDENNAKNSTEKKILKIYDMYEKILKSNNSLDKEDLVQKTLKLLTEHNEVLQKYRNAFKYILVDEYQDTNIVQHMLVTLLSDGMENVFAFANLDEGICKSFGANSSNVTRFVEENGNINVVNLISDYRNSKNIMDLANSVISNNESGDRKIPTTKNEKGDLTVLYYAYDERDEATYVTNLISDRVITLDKKYGDFAILYRNPAQARVIEDQLQQEEIPYKIYDGSRFYDKKEVKDIISYLRVIYNSKDEVSIRRVINIPKRNIGNTTLNKIDKCAKNNGLCLYDALRDCEKYDEIARLSYKIERFTSIIEELKKMIDTYSLTDIVTKLVDMTNYKRMLEDEETQDARCRIENINKLIQNVREFEDNNDNPTFENFIRSISLYDDFDFCGNDNVVKLMTVHNSKGTEFDTVFLLGFEDGIFPSYLSIFEDHENEIDEERRLLYVAITRAKCDLHITYTKSRIKNGQVNHNKVSRFFDEFPKELIECKKKKLKKLDINVDIEERATPNLYSMLKMSTLESSKETPKEVSMSFSVGDMIGHKKFGVGKVEEITPVGLDFAISVKFEKEGMKKMVYNSKTSGFFEKF